MFRISLTPWCTNSIAPVDSTFTEDIKLKDPYNNPIYKNDWFNYVPIRAGKSIPLTDKYKLPSHLYWICSNIKKIELDFYSHSKGIILSSAFFHFLKQFKCYDKYEIAEITPLSRKLTSISDKKYVFIRFTDISFEKFVDLEKSDRIRRKNKVIAQYLYLNFSLKDSDVSPDIFWMKNKLIAKEQVGELINEKGFLGLKMLNLKDFADEYIFRDMHPYPTLNEMKKRDKIWF